MTKPHLNDLTVFILSSGEETMDECLAALEAQDCAFKIDFIEGVSPMSAAFQAMPDRSRTPYFIQVDADVILNPDAVSFLYRACKGSGWRCFAAAAGLYEEGFGPGGAVRCWKRSVFRFFKYNDCRTVDRNLYQRLRRWGLRLKVEDKIIGLHKPRHSDLSFYLKPKSDVEKWRFLKRPVEMYARDLFAEIVADWPTGRLRLFGLLLGAMTGPDRVVRSKNAPLEKERYQVVLELIGQGGGLSAPNELPDPLLDQLRPAFEAAYDDFRTDRPARRQELARLFLELYSLTPPDEAARTALLELVDR